MLGIAGLLDQFAVDEPVAGAHTGDQVWCVDHPPAGLAQFS